MALSTYTYAFDPGDGRDERTLILLHGTGDNEQSFLRLGQAVAPKAAKIALRGNVHENGMARFFRRTGEGIYDMDDLALRTGQFDAIVNPLRTRPGTGRWRRLFERCEHPCQPPVRKPGDASADGAHASAYPLRSGAETCSEGRARSCDIGRLRPDLARFLDRSLGGCAYRCGRSPSTLSAPRRP